MSPLLYIEQEDHYEGNDWWQWSVWLAGPDEEINRVSQVTYLLHGTFRNPVRVVRNRSTRFRLDNSGWGTFTIRAEVSFTDGSTPLQLERYLTLTRPDAPQPDASLPEKPPVTTSVDAPETRRPKTIAARPGAAPARLFLSHSPAADQQINALKQTLLELSFGRLYVSTSAEFRANDLSDGKGNLEAELRQATLMAVLVDSEPATQQRMYFEWGYYTAARSPRQRPAVAVRAAGTTLPLVLASSQVYDATPTDLSLLVNGLLTTPLREEDPPLYEPGSVTPELTARLTDSIAQALGPGKQVTVDFAMRLYLHIDSQEVPKLREGTIPAGARVTGNPNALEVLGLCSSDTSALTGQPLLWEKASGALKPATGETTPASMWTDQLTSVLAEATNTSPTASALPNFYSPPKRRVYRPTLTRLERRADGGCTFEIEFTEIPRELSVDAWPPGALGATAHMLTLVRMFRWGVLIPYTERLERPAHAGDSPEQIESCYRDLDTAIANVVIDAQNRGISIDDVYKALTQPERKQFDEQVQKWTELYRKFRGFGATERRQPKLLLSALNQMGEINEAQFRLFSARYSQLVADYFAGATSAVVQ